MRRAAVLLFFFALSAVAVLAAETPVTSALPIQVAAEVPEAATIHGLYFGELGCNHCDVFLFSQRAELERRYNVTIALKTLDILKSEDYALCVKRLEERGEKFRAFPVLFVGNNAYQGNAAIEKNLPDEIEYYLKHAAYRPRLRGDALGDGFRADFLPVFAAGLLDGVNPCAFSSLLFFLSYLTLRGRSRRTVLATGFVFVLSVFAVYLLLGLGMLEGLRSLSGFRAIGRTLNVAIGGLAFVLGILSLRDAFRARAGQPDDAALKLPSVLAKANRFVIRTFTTRSAVLIGAAVTGVGVSLLELACTGQIYLPTLAYINRTARSTVSVFLLLVYNFAFVLPLLAVFILFFFGAGQEKIRAWYRRRLFQVRLLTGLFFFAMGALVLLG